ncbi:hypothetical protein GGR57DRAFT_503043 [Xylariaceae sp. FL1272]|nr:hypothetical protein GGR57DRAFT_503043 [Xylariaceae sp. FL1272]
MSSPVYNTIEELLAHASQINRDYPRPRQPAALHQPSTPIPRQATLTPQNGLPDPELPNQARLAQPFANLATSHATDHRMDVQPDISHRRPYLKRGREEYADDNTDEGTKKRIRSDESGDTSEATSEDEAMSSWARVCHILEFLKATLRPDLAIFAELRALIKALNEGEWIKDGPEASSRLDRIEANLRGFLSPKLEIFHHFRMLRQELDEKGWFFYGGEEGLSAQRPDTSSESEDDCENIDPQRETDSDVDMQDAD